MTELIDWLNMTIDTVDFSPYYDDTLASQLDVNKDSIGTTIVDLETELQLLGNFFDEQGNGKIPVQVMARMSQLFNFYRSLNEEQITTLDRLTTTVKQIRGII